MNLSYLELLLISLSILSLADLIRFYISKKYNKEVFDILEKLGTEYKTEFKIKMIVEKLLILMSIVWIVFRLLNRG